MTNSFVPTLFLVLFGQKMNNCVLKPDKCQQKMTKLKFYSPHVSTVCQPRLSMTTALLIIAFSPSWWNLSHKHHFKYTCYVVFDQNKYQNKAQWAPGPRGKHCLARPVPENTWPLPSTREAKVAKHQLDIIAAHYRGGRHLFAGQSWVNVQLHLVSLPCVLC